MAKIEYAEVGETVYFGFGLNDPADGTNADATALPLFYVAEAGAGAAATPTATGTCTSLTNSSYADGIYELGVDTTGYTTAKTYQVYVSAIVADATTVAMVGTIKTTPLLSANDVGLILKTTVASVTSVTEFVLTDGSDDNDMYVGCQVSIEDSDGDTSVRYCQDYIAATKTLEVESNPSFTVAATDTVRIYANRAESTAAVGNTTAARIETDTQDIQSRLPASLSNGSIDANVERVKDQAVTGSGTAGDPWGP